MTLNATGLFLLIMEHSDIEYQIEQPEGAGA